MAVILNTPERKQRAAEAFIRLGFSLILIGSTRVPLPNCGDCPAGMHSIKECPHPPSTCHGWQAGSRDLDHILGLLRRYPKANLGIVNGLSDLVTVDVDANKNGKPLPEAYKGIEGIGEDADGWTSFSLLLNRYKQPWPGDCLYVDTPSGGAHMTWRLPAGMKVKSSSDGSFGWLIDIRAAGSYTPAPGTPVTKGSYTRVGDTTDPAMAPEWLLHHLKITGHMPEPPKPFKPRAPRSESANREFGYRQLDKYADELATSAEGTGHGALCRLTVAAAHLVAEGLVSEPDARDALYDAGSSRPRSGVSQRAYDSEFTAAWRSALSKAGA